MNEYQCPVPDDDGFIGNRDEVFEHLRQDHGMPFADAEFLAYDEGLVSA